MWTGAAATLGLLPPARRRTWWLVVAPLLLTAGGLLAAAVLIATTPAPAHDAATMARVTTIAAAGMSGAPLLALLGAAVPEELLFRSLGVLTPLAWVETRTTPRAARRAGIALAVVSTLAFAAAHAPYGVRNVAVAALLGAGYSALTLASRSVLPAIAAHACYDTATFTLPVLLAH